MWSPKLSIQDIKNKDDASKGVFKMIYWNRDTKKYKSTCCRYGIKMSKEKALQKMEAKQAELRKQLTYDGNDKVIYRECQSQNKVEEEVQVSTS